MLLCGVIAEYNPFHNGHAYQIRKTREILGKDTAIVCAMSGNFVQRGDFSIMEKYARAKAAVLGGADLVVELPLAAALSSADDFAAGAVQSLLAAGCSALSFGCETANLALLQRAARALDEMPFTPERERSYAASMQATLAQHDTDAAALLSSPNNTLAISYLRAAKGQFNALVPILRQGAAHDSLQSNGDFASASLLRENLLQGRPENLGCYMPEDSLRVLQVQCAAGLAPVRLPDDIMLALLRQAVQLKCIDERTAGGFSQRLCASIYEAASYEEIVLRAKSKHIPAARVRRALVRTALNLPRHAPVSPQYLRVLAIGRYGRHILRHTQTSLPIIIKPRTEKALDDTIQTSLQRDAYADDVYALAYPAPSARAGGSHYTRTPYVLTDQ